MTDDGRRKDDGAARTLTSMGITLLGVILSVGTTVGLGIHAFWPIRLLAGAAVVVGLAAAIKLGTSSRRGPLARLANWLTSAPE